MKLGQSLSTKDISGRPPWWDQPHGDPDIKKSTERKRHQRLREQEVEDRWNPAIAELRAALADGQWHPDSVAKEIAERHGVTLYLLLDKAGVARDRARVIYALVQQ